MYLKSLTLKGFKSFANKTTLLFEPGTAAIVGPNGSGKSNISDAVLWVLGERNAKNLRGQAMEDVIFAGSSSRKAVSVAEVELLLDNSDGTLPVDFTEVSIGRRMYRNGESEYLINGSIVRRMDVLDILHDSGLGTATNSIISQGNLDAVLTSKPEDRRALIEEAAGILKHKERKARSKRKLDAMDVQLARVQDITNEVERQLKPLKRKARKAQAYQELSSQLADVQLSLAVDSLHILQTQFGEVRAQEQQLVGLEESLAAEQTAAEAKVDELQQQVARANENSTAVRVSKSKNVTQRMNNTLVLLEERKLTLLDEQQRQVSSAAHNKQRVATASQELQQVQETVRQTSALCDQAAERQTALEETYTKRTAALSALRTKLETITAQVRAHTHELETAQATQEALRENITSKQAQAEVLDARVEEAAQRLKTAKVQAKQAASQANQLQEELMAAKQAEAQAREQFTSAEEARKQARGQLDAARAQAARLSAKRSALEELETASHSANQALNALLTAAEQQQRALLSQVISVPARLDAVVELLLGNDVQAVLVEQPSQAAEYIKRARANQYDGTVSVLAGGAAAQEKRYSAEGVRLVDELSCDSAYTLQVEALLGDVYVYETFEEALSACQVSRAEQPLRCASLDGCVVYPNGKIVFVQTSEHEQQQSVLATHRNLEQTRAQEREAQQAYEQAQATEAKGEESYAVAQAALLKLSETCANLSGQVNSACAHAKAMDKAEQELVREYKRAQAEQKKTEAFFKQSQPDMDALSQAITQASAKVEKGKQELQAVQEECSPLEQEIATLSEQVSEQRLEVARLSERLAYAKRMQAAREAEINRTSAEQHEYHERMTVVAGALARVNELHSTLTSIVERAKRTQAALEQQYNTQAQQLEQLHTQLTQATAVARGAVAAVSKNASEVADVRIQMGRLEVQVQAAAKHIVQDCHCSLETAFETAHPVENRAELEELEGSLSRRIKAMGTINPDAAREAEELDVRYTYLCEQLEDMQQARRSLNHIVRLIDERMEQAFITTFDDVSARFSEVFSVLFPGGTAQLVLSNPDELDTTGVDVNAQPLGKRLKKMSLLSGGEKSMTALALLFAVYGIRQTPFYILDEVEAALDDTNLRRLLAYLEQVSQSTQLIMITHQRRTMEVADILYGVSMQADGITKVISQKLSEATRKEA